MDKYYKNYPLKYQNAIVAYLFAVTSATTTFIFFNALDSFIGVSFNSAQNLISEMWHIFSTNMFLFFIGWLFVFFSALVPFTVGFMLARRFKISHCLYFVIGAMLTAVLLEYFLVSIPELGINIQESELSFWQAYWNTFPKFLASGAFAGLVAYLYFRKILSRI